jgi:glycosyltransferase involved in cell wall biosynthesis
VKVFIASASLLPSCGGPAYSLARLASALVQAGVNVGLWTADQSARSTPLLARGGPVRRLSGSVAEALQSFGRPDVLHDSGIWLPHNHRLAIIAARRSIPRIVSTRGMLEPWARSHKKLKKSIAWRLFQKRDLQRADLLHATAIQEARNLQQLGLGRPVCVIPDGADLPEICRQRVNPTSDEASSRTALFVGRIYPVKGLPMLIEAWGRVRPEGWRLHIAGPDEAGHRAEVERIVSRFGLNEFVSFLGPLDGEAKSVAFADADLFVLPSHSESFGMVVAEALAHGVPVLTTRGTPWGQLVERECGWWVDATIEGLTQGLRHATAQEPAALRHMGARGRAWVTAEFQWETIAKRFLEIYERLWNGVHYGGQSIRSYSGCEHSRN